MLYLLLKKLTMPQIIAMIQFMSMKKINNDRGSCLMRRSAFSHESKLTKLGACIKAGMLFSLSLLSIRASAQVSVTASGGTTGPTVYSTLNSAFTAINAGTHQGTINIAITGNTTEPATPVPLLASGGTSSYTSINIQPSGGNFTINSNAAPAANRGVIELTGADNVTIDGDDPLTAGTQNLSIVAASVSTSGVACIRLSSNSSTGTDGANNNTIKNCIITGSRSSATSTTTNYGIQFSNGTSTSSSSTGAYSSLNTLIQNNIITRCYYGINAIGNATTYLNTGTQIKNNVIGSATAANYVAFRGIAISYTASTAGTGSAVIEANDIRTGHTSGSSSMSAIEVSSANAGILITRNNIHDCINPTSGVWGMYGIGITSSTSNAGITITNNFIRDIAGYPVSSMGNQYGGWSIYIGADATGIIINNNTMAQFLSTVIGGCILVNSSGATISQCLNNIMFNNVASANSCCFYAGATANISGGTINRNDYFVNAAGKLGYYNATQATLLNWQTATSKDANSLNENPPFVSATDLHLIQGAYSFLESAGAPTATTGVTVDIDNQTRPGPSSYGFGTAPDIGADEFDGRAAACGAPAPGNTVSSLSTPVCSGVTVTLSMSTPPVGPGFTFQWQSSQNNVTFTDISGATNNTYTGPANANYYRCNVTCSIGPVSATSTPVQVLYNNNVTGTTPGARCGNGTVSLAATGSAGATLKWYTAATGGTALGTGSPFTTPVINATTSYYVGAEALAPGDATVGTATTLTSATDYPTAFMNRHNQYWLQMVFTPAELNAAGLYAGNITALRFNTTTIGDAPNVTNFTVMMGPTSNTTLSTFTTTGLSTVYGPSTYSQTIGVNTITFSTPYPWDGTSNILVDIRQSGVDNLNNAVTYYTQTTGNTVLYAYTSSSTSIYNSSTTATTSTSRLNTTFVGQAICSSPRIPVTATVNTPPTFTVTPDQTICNNAITPLSVTSTLSNFNTYTWSPVTNLYTDAAATVPYLAGNSATTVYFKSATPATSTYTVNANNSTTLCAAITTSAVTVLPATVTAIATPSTICMSGSTTLALTPATGYGAATFQWQSSTDNVGFGNESTNATSISYTTPVLTATKYYRVVIKNSAGTVCLNSVSDTAIVNNPTVLSTTPATRCGPGNVTLAATANSGATLAWYGAATGGATLATSASYTPSVTATTNYWVAARIAGVAGTATIGSATTLTTATEEITAFCNRRVNYRMQMIFTVAELNAAGIFPGNITSVGFNISTLGDAASNNNYTVKMGTTSQATFSTYITTGLSTVYGPLNYTHVVGLNTITFANPFPWDGTSNIVLEISHDGIDNINNAQTYYTATTDNMSGYSYNSSTTAATTTKRLNTTFGFLPLCEGPRQQVTATVNPLPTITVTPSGAVPICAGTTTTLTATGGGNYQWRNASGNISGQTNNTFTTGTAGTYKVVVTTPATGCTDSSAAITVTVNPSPTVFIGNDTTFCSGNTLTLNAGNPGATYLWNNGSTNQTRAITATGTYSVKVTNSNNCSKSDTIQVTVNPTPVVNLGNDTTLCSGISYVLNSGNPGATRLWDNGTTAQTRTVTTNGTYYVRVTNSFNCTARDTVTTTFLPAPVVNLGNDRDICAGATTILDAGNPGETYLWDNGSTAQTRSVNTTGNYYVTVSNAAVNCKGTDTIHVTVHPLPVVNLGNDTTFCHGNTLTLNTGNPGASYLWNDNSTAQTLNVTSTGNYGVVVTDAYACVGSDNINILVKELPNGIINAVHGDTATYTFNVLNPQYVTTYTWNFGDGSPLVNGIMVQHKYAHNGIYNVSVLMKGECNDSTLKSRTVDVFDATGGTSIREIEDSKDLVLYPNPARDIVVIENKRNLKMKQITVYNIVGQVLSTTKADSEDKHKLHTQAFAAGVYTLRIETDKGIVIRKFEIMK